MVEEMTAEVFGKASAVSVDDYYLEEKRQGYIVRCWDEKGASVMASCVKPTRSEALVDMVERLERRIFLGEETE